MSEASEPRKLKESVERRMKINARERERKAQLVSLWQQRASGQRTEKDVGIFYGEMERAFPHLLNRQYGDPYWNLMRDLKRYIEDAVRRG